MGRRRVSYYITENDRGRSIWDRHKRSPVHTHYYSRLASLYWLGWLRSFFLVSFQSIKSLPCPPFFSATPPPTPPSRVDISTTFAVYKKIVYHSRSRSPALLLYIARIYKSLRHVWYIFSSAPVFTTTAPTIFLLTYDELLWTGGIWSSERKRKAPGFCCWTCPPTTALPRWWWGSTDI